MMVHNTITLSVLVLLAVAHHLSPHKDGASIFIDAHNMVGSTPKQQTTTKWHRVLEITTSSPTGDGLLTNTPTTDEPSLPPTFAPSSAKVFLFCVCA